VYIKVSIILLIALLTGCKSGPADRTAHTVVTAENCDIDTSEFYELATEIEIIAVVNESPKISRSCGYWVYGDRDNRYNKYIRLISNMHRRAK